ncbi:BZ3500_MvSof-1268-A1-R1_Chr6-3g08826 [Microbotryum saponariae]|uniref:BZ3500_MvSof-1268-A1-R1_Chr6-3g08826 protein n=1 Tax=Microbotryum saponariae TaxID=289078 RepID=A0A2X0MMV8_9BASI|nr:BZ3500_MvSof-1268-A1-R1_Chr6-3g08826 [Microbotryum saponariae]SDA07427.1 BZ3501_MvSof-1269-A2-R1_Chr6-2g08529 [Microbotryum saponariae]
MGKRAWLVPSTRITQRTPRYRLPFSRSSLHQTFSAAEVTEHKSAESAWTIVDGGVYDVTEFLVRHVPRLWTWRITLAERRSCSSKVDRIECPNCVTQPAGFELKLILFTWSSSSSCGKDSSDSFWKFHSKKILTKTAAKMLIVSAPLHSYLDLSGSVEGQAKL